MSRLFEVDPARPEDAEPAIMAATQALADGGLVVFPTETVYGIAARPDLSEATARLFEAKRRPRGLNLPVLAPTGTEAWTVAQADDRARRLAEAFWPGPLTIVLPRTRVSRNWNLGEARETVAVRVPDHAVCRLLLTSTGPTAATSANRSGRPPLQSLDELRAAFGETVAVYLVLSPGAPPPAGAASTVVDLTGATLRVLRAGPLTLSEVEQGLGR